MICLQKPGKDLQGTIRLPGSKSLSNRALIIRKLCKKEFPINYLSSAEDTQILQQALESKDEIIDIGDAGTAMRFLTAYFAITDGERTLTGSARMLQRPIGILVDALKELGADITYLGKEGYPPLRIRGKKIDKELHLVVRSNVSSQFISALILIAPVLPSGLSLQLTNETASRPYIEMTLRLLRYFGISYSYQETEIHIPHQPYQAREYTVESDWSSASYWYSMGVLSEKTDLYLEGLEPASLQGDRLIEEIMSNFGIHTDFLPGKSHLFKKANFFYPAQIDCNDCPDLAQTLIALCAFKGLNTTFTGLKTLRIKETDRINAMQRELKKIGVQLREKNDIFSLDCSMRKIPEEIQISTYGDHRMVMSFVPLAFLSQKVWIEDPDLVNKSYPEFWKDLQAAGFIIT